MRARATATAAVVTWLAAHVAACAAGVGWLCASVATGQRYPGLSLAWAGPALVGAVATAAGLVGLMYLSYQLGGDAGRRRLVWATAPLLLAWGVVGALLLSDAANHTFVNWPRVRPAVLASIVAPAIVAAQVLLVHAVARRSGAVGRLRARLGVTRLVFVGTLAVFLVSAGGHLYTPDEWAIYAVAAGLVNHGVPAAYADEPYQLNYVGTTYPPDEVRPDGTSPRAYSKYGIVPSLFAAPVYAVARLAGQSPQLPAEAFPYGNLALPLVPLVVNPFVTAAAAALLCRVARELAYGIRASAFTAAAFAFGSLAWPYSKTLMSMTLAGALLLAATWCLLRCRTLGSPEALTARSGRRRLIAAGAAVGLATATRYEAALLSLPLLVLLPWGTAKARLWLRALALFLVGGSAIVLPLVFGMNALRHGSLFETGYRGEGLFGSLAHKPWYGLFGIVFSPGCGLLTYTPLMALGLLSLMWLWEDTRAPAAATGLISLLAIAYYGSGNTWCGSTTWGPRYLLVAAPFMALPLAALWHRLENKGAGSTASFNPFAVLAVGGTFLWSASTNLLAVLIDFNRGWQDHWANDLTFLEVTWLPYFTGVTTHLRLLRDWLLDGRGGLDLYLLTLPFGGLLGIVLLELALICANLVWWGGDAPAADPLA